VNPIKVEVAFAAVAPKVPGVNGKIDARDDDDTLLLKMVQSVEAR
jgi:hypothetical protein